MRLTKWEVAEIVARLGITVLVLEADELELICNEVLATRKPMPATPMSRLPSPVRHTAC